MIPSINQISLADIEKNIQSEMQYFRYGQSALGEEYALELLRRALPSKNTDVHPDKAAAQEALISLYTKLIIANIRGSAINPDEIEDVTQQVWLNFWQSAQMGRLTFSSLASFLSYLRMATRIAIFENQKNLIDYNRYHVNASIEEFVIVDEKQDLFGLYAKRRFSIRIKEIISDPLEYRIFALRYNMGFVPREIAAMLNQEGITINDKNVANHTISAILERIFRRLEQDPEIREILNAESTVEVVIEGNLNNFDETQKLNLIQIFSDILEIKPDDVKIKSISSGSIKITIELPDEAATRLLALFLSNDPDIIALRIKSILEIKNNNISIGQALNNSMNDNFHIQGNSLSLSDNNIGLNSGDREEIKQELEHQLMITKERIRRFRILELQVAKKGAEVDPVIITEMEDLQIQIQEDKKKVNLLKIQLANQ